MWDFASITLGCAGRSLFYIYLDVLGGRCGNWQRGFIFMRSLSNLSFLMGCDLRVDPIPKEITWFKIESPYNASRGQLLRVQVENRPTDA